MKTISRYIMTLALLLTAVGGAWAQKQITITQDFENGMGDWTMNHCHNYTGITSSYGGYESSHSFRFYYTPDVPQYLISPELDENDGGTMSFYYARYSSNYTESFIVGYSTTTSEPSAFTWGNEQTVSNGDGQAYFNFTYNFPAGTKYVSIACTSNDQFYFFVDDIKIEYAAAEASGPDVEVTISDTKSEASFEMPQYDVTATYTIKRDISVDVTATMGDGTDGVRYRVKKAQQGEGYEPAEMDMMQVLALVAVNDGIEQKALTLNQDYFCRIYKLDEQTLQPTDDGVKLADFDFAPGLYALKAFAKDDSDYAGETGLSNTFQLFQGYQVVVPAGEFITYYKDEPLYADTETSADAVIYTIQSVSADQATLSAAIETAPSLTPLLIFNNSDEAKTFLLIPANEEPDLQLTVAPEFVGTLEATTIAASTDDQTNYAFNGKQFVWVKNAVEIGANKAWLSINTGVPSARITIVFDSEATGIKTTDCTDYTDSVWYDLNGRKVAAPSKKGIYIMNGKKVVVK